MNISQIRQRIDNLDRERRKLQNFLLKPQEMIRGSFYLLYKRCGNPKCPRCTQGEKHGPFAHLSLSRGGKTKLFLIRRKDRLSVKQKSFYYKVYQSRLTTIRKINQEIFEIFKSIRDSKTTSYK